MTNWVDVINVERLPPGARECVDISTTRVMVFNIEGEFYALENLCTHAYFELDDAEYVGCKLTCPLHGATFSIKTGEVLSPPAFEALRTFEVRVQDGMIQVKDEEG